MGRRLGARIIDVIILIAITIPVLFLFGWMPEAGAGPYSSAFLISQLIGLVIGVIYEAVVTGVKGATLGKMAVGIRVVNQENGEPVTMGASFTRYVVTVIIGSAGSFIPIFGFVLVLFWLLSPFFDRSGHRQGWHDKVAKTWVVAR